MPLEAGQILQNRYRVISLLTQGGMGAVYRAWDTRLNIPVALKEMLPQPGLDARKLAQLRRQFQQEAQTLASLDHPHLVGVIDFFAQAGNVYLVMKFIEGESLADCIERQGALSEKRLLALAEQLLNGLDYCHSRGIIHRDVKPQNVIIRPDGSAVLVDFGLVKMWDPRDPRTKTAMRGMGTPEYAPPEQYDLLGHTDARSDIYSLGATLYHALTGQAPPTATQRSASRDAFRPPRALNRHISPATEAAVLRAMELPVEDRFQSAQEMEAALRRAIDGGTGTRLILGLGGTSGSTKGALDIPGWVWGIGGVGALGAIALIVVLLLSEPGKGVEATPTSSAQDIVATGSAAVTEVIVQTTTSTPTSRVIPTPSRTSTGEPTSTPKGTATSEPTETPVSTATPRATPTPTPIDTNTPTPVHTATSVPAPTATSVPSATTPRLVAPEQGSTYGSPVTFQWQGSLRAGQTYQVTARHTLSDYVVQSGSVTGESWTADLPAERYGEWRWTVSVVQGGSAVATSSEAIFWFDPRGDGDGGGGGNGDEVKPTNTPPR